MSELKEPKKNPGSIKRSALRILVTGGAGFIGSHLCEYLLKQNEHDSIICVDNCFSGSKDNIAHLLTNPRFEFIRHDVTDPLKIQVDQIYHLACPASPVFYQHNGVETIKTCVLGTMNMLELAKSVKAHILLTSTSEVYGDPKEHPQKETYWGHVNPIGPRACYDESKRLAECLTMEYARVYNVKTHIARIFNTYGPNMLENDGRVVSNFITQILNNAPLTIYGDGKQTRSFCYVSDMCKGLWLLMNSAEQGPINLGNPTETTMNEFAEIISKTAGEKLQCNYQAAPADDPCKRKPDITIAETNLCWTPIVKLQEGLKLTIDAFKKRKANLLSLGQSNT
jgi:UDP-glucuronate decarboxylase